MKPPLLDIRNLNVQFQTKRGVVNAVDDLSLSVFEGETLGIVGESGCGKSVTALSILGLLPKPTGRIAGGSICFDGRDLVTLSTREMQKIRGNVISMIFQEPMTSLNPVYTVGFQLSEVLRKHRQMDKAAALEKAVQMLKRVGIPEPESRLKNFPHQLSGGMCQRVMIAMALCCQPRMIIADEPTTALDVTIQAQILDLISRLKQSIGTSVIFITHDLGVVAEICQRVAVMYAGRVVETAPVESLFETPAHPYTVGLFRSLPQAGGRQGVLQPIAGVVPSMLNLPPGCAFQDRCFKREDNCMQSPPWSKVRSGHEVRCWFPMEDR